MEPDGRALARVQYDAHRRLDDIYGPLAASVAAAVLAAAIPNASGPDRLPRAGWLPVRDAIARLLAAERPAMRAAIMRAVDDASDAADPATPPTSADPERTRALLVVEGSLLDGNEETVAQATRVLVGGIAAGLAATVIAKRLRDYFSPFFATYRDADGELIHTDRGGALAHWPGQSGMASARARLTMLTETTAAHGRAMVRRADREGLGLKWNLSPGHQGADECDDKANRDIGFGRGVYPPNAAPRIPSHPRCRCHFSTVVLRP